jgi:signal transduction histidine kinase/ActR/RegA family two-component response regulator
MSNQFGDVIGAAADIPELNAGAYALTLAGLVTRVSSHIALNVLAAASLALLGHPLIGLASFFSNTAIDVVYQARIKRLQQAPAPADDQRALRRLALLCATRNTILLTPAILIALSGGAAELVYFSVVVCILSVLAGANGVLSRPVFFAYAGPALLASVGVALVDFSGPKTVALLAVLTTFAVIMIASSEVTNRAVNGLRSAFDSNQQMLLELKAARDQALAERAAADEARETARRANAAKSNFLATMSHEIRTPMNGVLGMAQLLRRDEADPSQIERLDTLVESGQYLLSILNDILDVSKIDAGRLELSPHAEELPRFLGQVVDFWGARADERGVSLRLEVGEAVPAVVLMDALRMRQILFNLIGNALKFTEAGSVVLRVDARAEAGEVSRVRFAVCDTGPGIAPEHLSGLFDRFSQGDESEVRRFGGTGLGLAIARQLAELMGGRIWVESTLGQGSTFQIEVPLPLAVLAESSPDPAPIALADAPAELSVLIVDDNAVNLLVLEQLLSAFGHSITKAASGQEALDRLAETRFDLVLMDIQMPQMTGTEALRLLRDRAGPNREVPVIALTADVTSGGRARYLELGFDEHTPKPVQIADLMQAIGRAMARDPQFADDRVLAAAG